MGLVAHISSLVCLWWRLEIDLESLPPSFSPYSFRKLGFRKHWDYSQDHTPTWIHVGSEKLNSSLCVCMASTIFTGPHPQPSFLVFGTQGTHPSTAQWAAPTQHLQVACAPCPAELSRKDPPRMWVVPSYTLESQSE